MTCQSDRAYRYMYTLQSTYVSRDADSALTTPMNTAT